MSLTMKPSVYVFVRYAWEKRWIRSRAIRSGMALVDYVRSLPIDAGVRIAVRGDSIVSHEEV